jgi:hypothetical protein
MTVVHEVEVPMKALLATKRRGDFLHLILALNVPPTGPWPIRYGEAHEQTAQNAEKGQGRYALLILREHIPSI